MITRVLNGNYRKDDSGNIINTRFDRAAGQVDIHFTNFTNFKFGNIHLGIDLTNARAALEELKTAIDQVIVEIIEVEAAESSDS